MKAKVLVLGASGFMGSHLVRELQGRGFPVRVLLRPSSPLKALEGYSYETVYGDLNHLDSLRNALQGCDYLFHTASYYPLYSLQASQQKKLAFSQIQNVLQAARETPSLLRVVYTSSMSTIGKCHEGQADEQTPYHPQERKGLYYEIKWEMEQEVLQAARQGLPVVVMNPTGVFGERDVKPTSGAFILEIAKGRLPFLFDAKMNAVDVQEVARLHVEALEKGRVGERYILGGHNTTVWAFACLVAHLAGVNPPRLKLPLWLGRPVAYLSEHLGRYVFHQTRPSLPQVGIDFLENGSHYNCQKAREEFGLKEIPMEETVERALFWFREQGYWAPLNTL